MHSYNIKTENRGYITIQDAKSERKMVLHHLLLLIRSAMVAPNTTQTPKPQGTKRTYDLRLSDH